MKINGAINLYSRAKYIDKMRNIRSTELPNSTGGFLIYDGFNIVCSGDTSSSSSSESEYSSEDEGSFLDKTELCKRVTTGIPDRFKEKWAIDEKDQSKI